MARYVSQALDAAGARAYVPVKPIWESEAQWDDELIDEIRAADGVVFIEPETDAAAGHVLFEVGAARALGKRIIGVGRRAAPADFDETVSETILHSFDILETHGIDDARLAEWILKALA